jgi:hypothetical protein
MDKRSNNLEKAANAIPNVLEETKLLLPYKLYQVKLNWQQIMGPQIAKYSYIKDFNNHVVIIGVLNPVWMNHLFLYKKKIIEDINTYIHENIVQDVKFVRSGKKPVRPVYVTENGEEEKLFPQKNIKNMVLHDETVRHIMEETEHLPEKLREKIRNVRFAQEKRKLAYLAEAFIPCPQCGRWMDKEEKLCFLCRLKQRSAEKKKIYDILQEMPWLSLQELQAFHPCSDLLYNEVRRDCIYRLIDKIYHESDTPEDDLFLALFVLRKKPADLTDRFIVNLREKYRRKQNVSSHRRE